MSHTNFDELLVRNERGETRPATGEEILRTARELMSRKVRRGTSMSSPQLVRDFLAIKLGTLEHEIFCVLLLDSRHRLIEFVDLFRGTIDGASVHPREIVKLALAKNAAALVACHPHPLCCFGNCHPLKSRVELQGLPAQRTMTRRARRQGNPRWRGRAAARSLTACAAACVVSRAGNVA